MNRLLLIIIMVFLPGVAWADTYYLSNTDITASTLETLATSAPSTLDEAQGWTVAQKGSAPVNYAAYRPDTTISRTSTDWVTTEPVNFTQRGYRTAATLNGYFVSGNFVLAYKVKSNTYYAQKGYVKYRLWRSANADGSSATQITDGWKSSSLIGFTAANQYQTGTITWNSGATKTLTSEYLFLEIEWATNTSGGNNGAIVYWAHGEGAAEKLDTPNFITMYLSGAATLAPITAAGTLAEVVTNSGAATLAPVTAAGTMTKLTDPVNVSGAATLPAITTDGDVAALVIIGWTEPGTPDIGVHEFVTPAQITMPAITASGGMYYPNEVVRFDGAATLPAVIGAGTVNTGVSLFSGSALLNDIGVYESVGTVNLPVITASGTMTNNPTFSLSGTATLAAITAAGVVNEGATMAGVATIQAITAQGELNLTDEPPAPPDDGRLGRFFFYF